MPDNKSLVMSEGLIARSPGLWLGNVDSGALTRLTAGVESLGNVSVSRTAGGSRMFPHPGISISLPCRSRRSR